ncbi:hypothetical protein [Promicromonospora sp. NPDC050880]|uniref:hypothetical protein n=1 Tax=Promicromonospora sp. NPDC050880 TaxID=3364406 RepID=UPI0037BD2B77
MTGEAQDVPVRDVPGRTRISARALEHLAVGLVRDAAHAAQREVVVRLADAGGVLKVTVTVPVTVAPHLTGSIADRGAALRQHVIDGMRDLAGRRVDVVDVRYSGVRRTGTRVTTARRVS